MIDFYGQLKLLLLAPQTGDMVTFQQYANNIAHGLIPYVNFHPEYPPFAYIFMYLPYLFDKNPSTYLFWFGVCVTIAIIFGAYLIWLWDKRISKVYLFVLLLFLIQSSYQFVYQRFDIFVAVITFASVYLFFRLRKEGVGWFLLFVGTMTKIFPLVLFPLFFIKARNKLLSLWFLIPMAGLNIFLIWTTNGQYLNSLAVQGFRPLEFESLISTFMIGAHLFMGTKLDIFYAVNSWNITIPKQLFFNVRILVYVLLAIPFVISYFKKSIGRFSSIRLATILITGFILANIVLCPQYLIWLIPFVPFLDLSEIGIFTVAIIITTAIFSLPINPGQQNDWIYLMIFIRNILLVVFYYKLYFVSPRKV